MRQSINQIVYLSTRTRRCAPIYQPLPEGLASWLIVFLSTLIAYQSIHALVSPSIYRGHVMVSVCLSSLVLGRVREPSFLDQSRPGYIVHLSARVLIVPSIYLSPGASEVYRPSINPRPDCTDHLPESSRIRGVSSTYQPSS